MPAVFEEDLRAACQGVAGIITAQFRDIAGRDIPVETLRAYALSFADGIRVGGGSRCWRTIGGRDP